MCRRSSVRLSNGRNALCGSKNDQANDVVPTPDGGFIVAGQSSSNDGDVSGHHGSDSTDGWIAKLDATGNIQWQRSIGGSGRDYFSTVIPTSDNAWLCIGTSSSNDGDVSGNHGGAGDYRQNQQHRKYIVEQCFGGSNWEILSHGVLTYDGGFALIGETRSTDGNVSGNTVGVNGSTWLIRLDSTGALQWQKCYATIRLGHRPGHRRRSQSSVAGIAPQ